MASGAASPAELAERFEQQSAEVRDRAGYEELRLAWTGRKKGILRALLAGMKDVAPEERREYGQAVNVLKTQVEAGLEALGERLDAEEREAARQAARLDVTLPGRRPDLGSLHPVTLVNRELEAIFAEMGYSVAEGPEAEDDYHNFEALNFPHDHPARDTQDTFFLESGALLRTHTSPVQIRTMLRRAKEGGLPIRVICPGKVYRNDNDLRHSPMFHQVEGLAVGEGITVGDLKGTLEAFVQRLFTADTGVRLRPSFFPFTEPSAEVDITCPFCAGTGVSTGSDEPCGVCSATGWMEILGSGMVDPRVLAECEIDPERYTGFAFGLGVDRVAMIRYGIPNIRMLFENDERLLRQVHA